MRLQTHKAQRRPRWGASLLALSLMIGVAGCDQLLEVSNPNNIAGDDVLEVAAAAGMVSGALSGVARGYAGILTSYATVTDELEWVGSRDAYQELDFGFMVNPFNEFTDFQFVDMAQGRWMADEAIRILTIHDGNGDLSACGGTSPTQCQLAQAYIYAAIARIIIADMYEDYVFSDRSEEGAPIGPANMGTLYDQAVANLTTAIGIAQGGGDADLETLATALRARAYHGRAVWNALNPFTGGTVTSAEAVTDATAALALMSDPDYKFQFAYTANTVAADIGDWVNDRQEMRIGPAYATPDPGAPTFIAVALEDIIDAGTVSPELSSIITAFSAASDFPSLTIVSAREMHLILAENAIGTAAFTTHINNLRALDAGLTAFSGQVAEVALLNHSRRTNLFMQGRRWSDHDRFGDMSIEWQATSNAASTPGVRFPIACVEVRANSNLSGC